ncbi:MAG: hypothetical protein AW10_02056 [Candidatus Accumulibacter appositus]|uniref:Uncharacterized protein n=1 Tax=Candidatus Accumulibacter appositus TaxID=1454003 RepID=A0A011NBK1_9PROT|nr:MAG: hypothetical protein AW10_02056 [Candidatus Accumulibacter appositus]
MFTMMRTRDLKRALSLGWVTMYRLTGWSWCIKSRILNSDRLMLRATMGSRYRARYDLAVDSTEPASSSGRSIMSRAADPTAGWFSPSMWP